MARFAREVWSAPQLAEDAEELRASIIDGVQRFGTTTLQKTGQQVYCYETDGLGNCNLMDDANIPSLLSLPYLDPETETFDRSIYQQTRRFVLSDENPWFFRGLAGEGVGSP